MAPKKNKSSQLKQTTLLNPSKSSARASSSRTPTQQKRKRNTRIPRVASDDDDDSMGIGHIKFTSNETNSATNGDGDIETARKRRKTVVDSDDSDRVAKPKKRLKQKTIIYNSDEDDDTVKPRRHKLKKKRDVALISSDDEDLADEVEKERIIASRFRNRNKKTAFQKNLERLKSEIFLFEKPIKKNDPMHGGRKQGKPSPSPSSSSGEESDTESDTPFKGARPSSDFDSLFDEDSEANSSDFIVEDDNSVPVALPMQFSMQSHQELDHQFKEIFQFFVHIAVRPAKERHYFMKDQMEKEEYFFTPLTTVRRKLSGLRESLVASSVWRPEFKNALAKYPEFDLIPLDFAVPSCDACNLGARMSTLIGRLSGTPYDPLGFEIKDEDPSGSSSSGSEDNGNSGSEKKASVVEFHLGRFCARRTRVYHEFTHWEYALFKCIRDEVDELHENRQSGGFFRIAYAGGIEPPKDLDDADGICDWLDQRKVIDMEWTKIKDMMESARHLELEKKRGDDD